MPAVPSASRQPWISAAAWLKRFSSIATIFARAICVEHLSRNVQKDFEAPLRAIFNLSICFALTETRLQVGRLCIALISIHFALTETHLQSGFVELGESSPQAVNYLHNSGLELWVAPRFPGGWVWAQHI